MKVSTGILLSISLLGFFVVQSCKTDSATSDAPAEAPAPTATPTPTTTTSGPAATASPSPATVGTTNTTPTLTTAQATSLAACVTAWQKARIAAPPQTTNFAGIRVINGTGQAMVVDPNPAAAGAAPSLVLVQLAAATTGTQLYGAATWYCIDNSQVPNTVALNASLCTSGHGADGSPGVGAKSLKFTKDKNC